MADFLSYGRQSVSDEDIEAVERVLRSDRLTQGPAVEEFERRLCEVTQAEHAVSCNSGTAALHLAALAVKLEPGKAAIVPAMTFLATANAVRMTGAEVVFADVDAETGRMTEATLGAAFERAAKASQRVQAVFPVHLAGAASAMPEIAALSAAHDAVVVEDACHALGGSYTRNDGAQVRVGSCPDSVAACFSFHPVKPVTTAEGGAVTTNDAGLASHMRRVRSHGMTRAPESFRNRDEAFDVDGSVNPWYYEMPEIGWNYRISDLHCALGISQLKRLDSFHMLRAYLADRYREELAALAPVVKCTLETPGVTSGHHLFVVLIEFERIGRTRSEVMRAMRDKDVGTQVHYVPVPWQPYYRDRYGAAQFPGAELYYRRCISLPLFFSMTELDVARVVAALSQALGLRV